MVPQGHDRHLEITTDPNRGQYIEKETRNGVVEDTRRHRTDITHWGRACASEIESPSHLKKPQRRYGVTDPSSTVDAEP